VADDVDQSQKTEEPSQRRLAKARDKGQVVQSREVNNWFVIGTALGLVVFLGPSTARSIGAALLRYVEAPQTLGVDGALWPALDRTLATVGGALLLPMALLLAAAIAGALLLRPELERMSVLSGAEAGRTLGEIARLAARLGLGVFLALTLIAVLDYGYQRFSFMRSMRMSKQEVKEEHKQSEGDPVVRARLRQIRVERARKRMMAAVPTASVVVTNPTHFAVALRYEMGTEGAPRVVAKGADLIAQRIREVAAENKVPIVENPPLARALYGAVELDQEIPPEHYKAVAEIIGYVLRLQGKLRPRARPSRS
jgi:flagellar biosynthetic protein FlhB